MFKTINIYSKRNLKLVNLKKDPQVELLKSESSYDLLNGHCTVSGVHTEQNYILLNLKKTYKLNSSSLSPAMTSLIDIEPYWCSNRTKYIFF